MKKHVDHGGGTTAKTTASMGMLLKNLEIAIQIVDSFAWATDERRSDIRFVMNACVKAISGDRLLMRQLSEIAGIAVRNKTAVKKAISLVAAQLAMSELSQDVIGSGQ